MLAALASAVQPRPRKRRVAPAACRQAGDRHCAKAEPR